MCIYGLPLMGWMIEMIEEIGSFLGHDVIAYISHEGGTSGKAAGLCLYLFVESFL